MVRKDVSSQEGTKFIFKKKLKHGELDPSATMAGPFFRFSHPIFFLENFSQMRQQIEKWVVDLKLFAFFQGCICDRLQLGQNPGNSISPNGFRHTLKYFGQNNYIGSFSQIIQIQVILKMSKF